MSLDWDITACKDKTIKDGDEWKLTETLIFTTMAAGIGHIKDEATAKEFFRRVTVYEKLRGVLLFKVQDGKPSPCPVTLADCVKRIGLHTNVSTISPAKFWRQIVPKWAQRYADEALSREETK